MNPEPEDSPTTLREAWLEATLAVVTLGIEMLTQQVEEAKRQPSTRKRKRPEPPSPWVVMQRDAHGDLRVTHVEEGD